MTSTYLHTFQIDVDLFFLLELELDGLYDDDAEFDTSEKNINLAFHFQNDFNRIIPQG